MTAGEYRDEDELPLDAMLTLEDIERRGDELRDELSRRIRLAGNSQSQPFDRKALRPAE